MLVVSSNEGYIICITQDQQNLRRQGKRPYWGWEASVWGAVNEGEGASLIDAEGGVFKRQAYWQLQGVSSESVEFITEEPA